MKQLLKLKMLWDDFQRERAITDLMLHYKLQANEAAFWMMLAEEEKANKEAAAQDQIMNLLSYGLNHGLVQVRKEETK